MFGLFCIFSGFLVVMDCLKCYSFLFWLCIIISLFFFGWFFVKLGIFGWLFGFIWLRLGIGQ